MRVRPPRTVDMLPLLDIILVVLFVFATIDEGEQSKSQGEVRRLEQEIVDFEKRNKEVVDDFFKEQQTTAQLQAELENLRLENAAAVEELKAQAADTQERLKAAEDAFKEIAQTKVQINKQDTVTLEEIERVRSNFESIVNEGIILTELSINSDNSCCFRQNNKGDWRRCGLLTPETFDEGWLLRGEGQEIFRELQRVKGGNGVVIIAQHRSSYGAMRYRLRELILKYVSQQTVIPSMTMLDAKCE
jgi:hypothetical protein